MSRSLLKCGGLALIAALLPGLPARAAEVAKPNLVLILVDDMPWFGTPVRMDADMPASAMAFRQMPNVEKLSAQGMTFRNARSAAGMCAPSRCAIQTGMLPARTHFSGNGGFGTKTDGSVEYLEGGKYARLPLLAPEPQGNIRDPSIGDVLRTAGYATAHFGKWHIYGGGPAEHGYDESDGDTNNNGFDPIDPATGMKTSVSEDPKRIFSITRRGLDFVERQARARRPFYLQLSHYATHAHYQARKDTLEKYEKDPFFDRIADNRERSTARLCAAMAEDLDTSVGMLLARLKDLGLADSTFVVFTADNGYRSWNDGQDPLRGGKWWLWENGVRVPLIVRGPGIAHGSRSAVNVVGYDFLPTFADLAGATAQLSKNVDGTSLVPVLLGRDIPASLASRPLYFHYPHYRVSPPCSAMVIGDRKLLHFYEWPDDDFLYNLQDDLGEKRNLARVEAETATRMHRQLMDRLTAVGGYFPKPNPQADPKARRYDPANLSDQDEEGDPEVGESATKKKKKKK